MHACVHVCMFSLIIFRKWGGGGGGEGGRFELLVFTEFAVGQCMVWRFE